MLDQVHVSVKKHIQNFQVKLVRVHGANVTLLHEEASWILSCIHRLHMYSSHLMHSLWGGVVGGVGGGATGKVLGWY